MAISVRRETWKDGITRDVWRDERGRFTKSPEDRFEVVLHLVATRGEGKRGLEDLEVRVVVQATDAEDAELRAVEKISDVVPGDWIDFLLAVGLLGPSANVSVSAIEPKDRYDEVRYSKWPHDGSRPDEPTRRFRK